MKLLLVVDMQNDFIDGALGTKEAVEIVPRVSRKIDIFDGKVIYTRDTHYENYLESQEGRKLPVVHCVKGTKGWEITDKLPIKSGAKIIDKLTFGSSELGNYLIELNGHETIESIVIVGLCTDICVISNAMIAKAFLPEAEIIVDSMCCAGVTVESHKLALEAMKACQITVL